MTRQPDQHVDDFLEAVVRQARVTGSLVTVLAVELPHLVEYDRLPLHHRDPFDRLLAAQARVLRTPIVSADPNFRRYDVPVVW